MERLWVEGYWSPSRLPSGGLGGSCVAPHNLITSYHRSQHIDSNLDNNLNNTSRQQCVSVHKHLHTQIVTSTFHSVPHRVHLLRDHVLLRRLNFLCTVQSVLFAISRSISSRLLKSHVEKRVSFSLPLQFRFWKKRGAQVLLEKKDLSGLGAVLVSRNSRTSWRAFKIFLHLFITELSVPVWGIPRRGIIVKVQE